MITVNIFFRRIGAFLTGSQKDLSIENKIFNILAFLAAVTCYVSFFSNLFIGFPLLFNLILLACAIIFSLFFYLSAYKKITRPLEIPLQIVAIILLVIVWFFSAGIEGSGTFYFFLVTFAFIYSSTHKKYWLILAVYLILAVILVFLDYYFDWERPYQSEFSRLLDLSVNMVVSLAILGFTAILLKQNYDRERQKVEQHAEELKNLNATKDKFFSIISHDLRNPFSNLLGLSRQLSEDLDSYTPEELRERIKLIEESSKRGYELLENLLEWSMSQRGNIKFNPLRLNLSDVINESVSILENQVKVKNINIITEVNGDLSVYADYNMLKVVLRNLITNAIKYSHPDGSVIVRAAIKNENEVEISVKDKGVGIPEDEIAKLFRIDTKYTTPGTSNEFGTGLGLILCKEFIEKHNGKISVESNVSSGSIFRFTLPK